MPGSTRSPEQALQLHHVEPLAVLAPDLPLHADQFEAGRLVQPDGRLVVAGDPGDHRMEAVGGRPGPAARPGGPAPPPCPAGRGRRRPSSPPWPSTPSVPGRATGSRSRGRSPRWPRPGRPLRRRGPRWPPGPGAPRCARGSRLPAQPWCGAPCRRCWCSRGPRRCRWPGWPRRRPDSASRICIRRWYC